jgi:CheY-like chemotaxis protein
MQVLLIEGLTDARETLAELLEALGYHVTAVAGAAEARQVTSAPDVLISDLSLRDGSLFSLAEELRRQPGWGGVRVLALTAQDDPENRRRAEEAGFHGFLTKPVSIWVLHGKLQEQTPV